MSHYYKYITPEEYERAAGNGIPAKLLEKRIRETSWDKERAMTEPVKQTVDRSYWRKIAEDSGISRSVFYARIHMLKWSEERAATTPKMSGIDAMEIVYPNEQRVIKREHVAIAAQNGISYPVVYNRVRKGMSVDEACTVPLMKGRYKKQIQRSN